MEPLEFFCSILLWWIKYNSRQVAKLFHTPVPLIDTTQSCPDPIPLVLRSFISHSQMLPPSLSYAHVLPADKFGLARAGVVKWWSKAEVSVCSPLHTAPHKSSDNREVISLFSKSLKNTSNEQKCSDCLCQNCIVSIRMNYSNNMLRMLLLYLVLTFFCFDDWCVCHCWFPNFYLSNQQYLETLWSTCCYYIWLYKDNLFDLRCYVLWHCRWRVRIGGDTIEINTTSMCWT